MRSEGEVYNTTFYLVFADFMFTASKCSENGLNIADRQNARSASTAVNAILQLHQQESRLKLHRKVLVFSISHDHSTVKIYGHYALIKDKTTFHRHIIHHFDLTAYDGQNRWTAYFFVRKVYEYFAPIHLKRIQSAVAQLDEPQCESLISTSNNENDSELPDSQETASAPASQGNEVFIKPALPPKKRRQTKDTEIAVLQQELEQSRQQLVREKEENKQRHAELMELLKEQKEQLKEQKNQNDKLLDLLTRG